MKLGGLGFGFWGGFWGFRFQVWGLGVWISGCGIRASRLSFADPPPTIGADVSINPNTAGFVTRSLRDAGIWIAGCGVRTSRLGGGSPPTMGAKVSMGSRRLRDAVPRRLPSVPTYSGNHFNVTLSSERGICKTVKPRFLGDVERGPKMLEGHLPKVLYHQVFWYRFQ